MGWSTSRPHRLLGSRGPYHPPPTSICAEEPDRVGSEACDFFGEISVLDGGSRTATVVAETPMVLLRIGRAGVSRIVKEDPGVGLRMLEELARRLRRMERPLAG